MNNFELKISFKLGFCLGFANLYGQTNKLLSELTLHHTVYTLQYVPICESSVNQKQAKGATNVKNYFLTSA